MVRLTHQACLAAFVGTLSLSASAEAIPSMTLDIEIPRLAVAEYHRPYVAIWLADERHQAVANLNVWYDISMANQEGETWLKDLRQWWRRSGRTLDLPVDGVSGATRAPGVHQVSFTQMAGDGTVFAQLPPGQYFIHVEAVREVGGREMLSFPVTFPLSTNTYSQQGQHELGKVQLTIQNEGDF
ncbi:MAG: DUF2271 domain-containing protein [Aliidiomarina sp.]|uniref:DUF2271 domain-containing protein n=1 Tax=Aliidiomarina sp. TaxID=1872439 RepID=UPI0025C496C9|nr:DUF2271 domain-containing protein [Aliidiomarina sp.]MCH8500839.1 DUF2271 domain-containing protein [Aliidiomarina sp.]